MALFGSKKFKKCDYFEFTKLFFFIKNKVYSQGSNWLNIKILFLYSNFTKKK